MTKKGVSRPFGRQEQGGAGCGQRLWIIGRGHPHGIGQRMIKPSLRLLQRPPEEFPIILPADQPARPMETIVGKASDQDGIFKTQLPPVGFNPRDQFGRGFGFTGLRLFGHGVFHW